MKKVTSSELIKDITYWAQELGLTSDEIVEKLNEKFEATDENKMTRSDLAKLKARLGIKNMKPKKKALFEIVDEEDNLSTEENTETITTDSVSEENTPYFMKEVE